MPPKRRRAKSSSLCEGDVKRQKQTTLDERQELRNNINGLIQEATLTKKHTHPLMDFLSARNKSSEKGWLRRGLWGDQSNGKNFSPRDRRILHKLYKELYWSYDGCVNQISYAYGCHKTSFREAIKQEEAAAFLSPLDEKKPAEKNESTYNDHVAHIEIMAQNAAGIFSPQHKPRPASSTPIMNVHKNSSQRTKLNGTRSRMPFNDVTNKRGLSGSSPPPSCKPDMILANAEITKLIESPVAENAGLRPKSLDPSTRKQNKSLWVKLSFNSSERLRLFLENRSKKITQNMPPPRPPSQFLPTAVTPAQTAAPPTGNTHTAAPENVLGTAPTAHSDTPPQPSPTKAAPLNENSLQTQPPLPAAAAIAPVHQVPPVENQPNNQDADLIPEMKEREDRYGMVTLEKTVNNRKRDRVYMQVPQTKKTSAQMKRDTIRKHGKRVNTFVDHLCDGHFASKLSILREACKPDGIQLIQSANTVVNAVTAKVFRRRWNVTANMLYRIMKDMYAVTGLQSYGPQFQKQFAVEEKRGVVKPVVKLMSLITKKNKQNMKREMCVYWRPQNPHTVICRAIQSSYASGRYQESSEFSSKMNLTMISFGADRSVDDLTLLARCINQKKGNTGFSCQVLGYVEKAAECYENERNTIYDENEPIRALLQGLVFDLFHEFSILIKDPDGKVRGCCTKMVQLSSPITYSQNISLSLSDLPDLDKNDEEVMADNLTDFDDEDPPLLILHGLADLGPDGVLPLQIQLVVNRAKHSIAGYRLIQNGSPVMACIFENPLMYNTDQTFEFVSRQVVGFPAEDTKQAAIVAGMAGNQVMMSCLYCLLKGWSTREQETNSPPEFFNDINPTEFPIKRCRRGQLREGEFSNDKLYRCYEVDSMNGQLEMTRSGMERCGSVTKEPLLIIPLNKINGCPMHMMQGLINGFLAHLRVYLRDLDSKTSGFVEKVDEVQARAELVIDLAKTPEQQATVRQSTTMKSAITRLENRKCQELQKGPANRNNDLIAQLEQRKRSKMEELRTFETTSGLCIMLQRIKGSKELAVACQDYKKKLQKKESKMYCGPLQHSFDWAVQLFGGVYRAEHGGKELSLGDGITTMENFNLVVDAVKEVEFDGTPDQKDESREQLNKSLELANVLFTLARHFKHQDKITDDDVEEIRQLLVRRRLLVEKLFPDTNTTVKGHHAEHHTVDEFILRWYFFGRSSEEGMEACHSFFNRIRSECRSIRNTKHRIELTSARIQAGLDPEFQKKEAVLEGEKKIRNVLYANKGKSLKRNEQLNVVTRGQEGAPAEAFRRIADDMLIPAGDYSVYNMAKYGTAIPEWNDALNRIKDRSIIGNAALAKATETV